MIVKHQLILFMCSNCEGTVEDDSSLWPLSPNDC